MIARSNNPRHFTADDVCSIDTSHQLAQEWKDLRFELYNSIRRRRDLTGAEKELVIQLLHYEGKKDGADRQCWPSLRTMANALGVSSRSVSFHLRVLCIGEFVARRPWQEGDPGGRFVTHYQVQLPFPPESKELTERLKQVWAIVNHNAKRKLNRDEKAKCLATVSCEESFAGCVKDSSQQKVLIEDRQRRSPEKTVIEDGKNATLLIAAATPPSLAPSSGCNSDLEQPVAPDPVAQAADSSTPPEVAPEPLSSPPDREPAVSTTVVDPASLPEGVQAAGSTVVESVSHRELLRKQLDAAEQAEWDLEERTDKLMDLAEVEQERLMRDDERRSFERSLAPAS